MNALVSLDSAGRLVLPKAVRDALHMGPGDALELESDGERVVLSPVRVRPGLRKELGVWVFYSGKPAKISISELIDQGRQERVREILEG